MIGNNYLHTFTLHDRFGYETRLPYICICNIYIYMYIDICV